MLDVKRLYDQRFTTYERVRKNQLWQIFCREFLQQFVKKDDLVVDLGAGQCEFINNINCGKKIAVDVSLETKKYAAKNVRVVNSSVKELLNIFSQKSVDVVFMSNLLEHLDNKEDVFRLLGEAHQVLRDTGRLLIMQPDIGLVKEAYWDFFDHKVPLTCASLTEALLANGFKISFLRYPFLPYSTKVRYLPLWPALLKIYLHFRLLHFIFGKQFFVCAEKK